MDEAQENRVAGAVGFNVRTGNYHVFKSKTVIVAAGGASNIYKPRSVGEGAGRVWYAPWSSGSAYGLLIGAGAKMTQMENRIVLARFKDGYGLVGAYFLHLKTYTQNGLGEGTSQSVATASRDGRQEYLTLKSLTRRTVRFQPVCVITRLFRK